MYMTLAETQAFIKKMVVFSVGLTIMFYVGKFTIDLSIGVFRSFFPERAPSPSAKFGILPRLKMNSVKIDGNPTYSIGTVDQTFPSFPDRANVYKYVDPGPIFMAEDRVKRLATKFGFKQDAYVKSGNSDYKWSDGNKLKVYDANVVNKTFKVNTNMSKLSELANNSPILLKSDATTTVSNFLKAEGLISASDQPNLYFQPILSSITLGRLREEKIATDRAKIIKVNVFRNVIGQKGKNIPVLSNDPDSSIVSFYVTNQKSPDNFPIINFSYWEVDYEQKSEYFLASISSVWEAISQNKGIITSVRLSDSDYYDTYKPIKAKSIEIRNVYVAYYESQELSKYLQPIYVFEGEVKTEPEPNQLSKSGKIVIYYPAIRGDYVE